MEPDLTSLRGAAPRWSLAGDRQLLDILQNIHQSLVSRCQEVNQRLDEMVVALDGASVDLQNVNNKFMALSNNQFIESRVYDDDTDIAREPAKEPPQPTGNRTSDLDQLKHSIRALENSHEVIEILDSDSDDSEDEELARTVLKPKDMYEHRPLPYIIGSKSWRSKWHAGLQPSDSESDSEAAEESRAQYSDSETEPEVTSHRRTQPEIEESTGSSSLQSEQESNPIPLPTAPSDVAAELARRLGGDPAVKVPILEQEYSPIKPAAKVYRPDQPSAGTVFCDEPPPLDYESDHSSEGDIFAELHKSGPHAHSNKSQSRLAEELFSGLDGDMFGSEATSTPVAKKPSLEDEAITNKIAPAQNTMPENESVKKPVGGISLFGNNKGAESIGAAILRRHHRQSSEDDSDVTPQTKEPTPPRTKEKDIFDDLFAKSEKEQKMKEKKKEPIEKEKPKVDLFSDNLFDDIDDIFAGNISTVKKEAKNKPLFDDDDDLFSDIAETKKEKDVKSNTKSIFDSDDDLFADKPAVEPRKTIDKNVNRFENVDDIFSDIIESNDKTGKSNVVNDDDINVTKSDVSANNTIVSSEVKTKINDNLSDQKDSFVNKEKISNKGPNNNIEKSTKSLFDDEDDDDLFGNDSKPSTSDENSNIVNKPNVLAKSDGNSSKSVVKSSLFGDDSDDNDIFGSSTKSAQDNNNKNIISKEADNRSVVVNKNETISKNNSVKTSIFDDDDDDIFATSSNNSNVSISNEKSNNSIRTHKQPAPKTKSLFDDEDSDDSNLFSKIDKKPSVEQKPVQTNQKPEKLPTKPPVSRANTEKLSIVDENSSIKEQKEIVEQKPTIQDIKTVKEVTILNENTGTDKEQEETHRQQTPSPKPVVKQQKPVINNEKPTLQQKPLVPQEKPSIVQQKPDEVLTEVSKEKVDSNSTSETEIEPNAIGNKVPIKDDNINESVSSIEGELSAPPDVDTKTNLKEQPIEYKIPDLDEIESNEDGVEKDALFSEPQDPEFKSPAVFDDIFSEPPAFEKSAEPKKSKNVNALFDDDSDDEALFFKKNDVTLDEAPDLKADTSKDALFGIFHDEPPAIEVDFTQKPAKSSTIDDFLKSDSDDDIFAIKSNKKDTLKSSDSSQKYIISDDSANSKRSEDDAVKTSQKDIDAKTKTVPVLDKAELFEQKTKIESKPPKDTTDSDTKKVGKLKSMNFNIDVSTLLPGASPKKKSIEQTDGQMPTKVENIQKEPKTTTEKTLTTQSHEDLHTKDKIEHVVTKSISFDGEPDSNILDNKLSKERAKIQVKRRPSTRRARREAVRKSAIDLADDSTDNSSSFDEPRPPRPRSRLGDAKTQTKTQSEPKDTTSETKVIATEVDNKSEVKDSIVTEKQSNNLDSDITNTETEPKSETTEYKDTTDSISGDSTEVKSNIASRLDVDSKILDKEPETTVKHMDTSQSNITPKEDIQNEPSNLDEDINKTHIPSNPDSTTQVSKSSSTLIQNEFRKTDNKNVTSKIVYILNDEDIFTNTSVEKPQTSKVLPIVNDDDDDDDIFKNIRTSSDNNASISTLGKTYSDIAEDIEREVKSTIKSRNEVESQSKVDRKSNKTDIKANQTKLDTKRHDGKVKKSLFDDLSDDENELFNSNKKTTKSKGILDSDSEDDLFGGRKKGTKDTQAPSERERDVMPKMEVKGSLFGDEDDDDDLFGIKTKSNVATTSQPIRTTKETATKPAELVFDDPLSLLGGDDD